MQIIPLNRIPNQNLQVQLSNQACTINVVQMAYGLFVSLYIGSTLIISNVLAQNLNRIVRDLYLDFSGDLLFYDTQGTQNPDYTGLGGPTARYQFIYLEPSDLPSGEG
jgi:hypothetical protein